MTDELEPVDDATQYRRKIDDSLARFSAAHDELAAEETQRKQRRERLVSRPGQLIEQTRTRLQRVVRANESDAPARQPADAGGQRKSPQTRLQEKKERHNRRSIMTGKVSAVVVAALVFLATGIGWTAKTWFNSQFNEIAALDQGSAAIRNAAGQSGDQNFLIVGSDTRAGASSQDSNGTAGDTPGARADTIMIAHVPDDRQRPVVVSFPRDLEVARPDCRRWDPASGNYGQQRLPAEGGMKLNSVYATGGPRCVTKLAQQLSGMKINHFVGVDFNGFKDMVDAVGGVTVHTDGPVDDSILGPVIPQGGDTPISGHQALNFVRARHVAGDPTSDYGRIHRQQVFLAALLQKTMSHDVLFDPGKLTGFVRAFAAATFGENIGVDQMLGLAQSMRGTDSGKVAFVTVPTTGESNARGNEVLLENKTHALFQALIDNRPLPNDKAATTGARPPTH